MADKDRPVELCCECDEPTGHAGRGEDSWYCDLCDAGPFCDSCGREHEAVCQEIADLAGTSDASSEYIRAAVYIVRALRNRLLAAIKFGCYAKVLMIDDHVTPEYLAGYRERFAAFEKAVDGSRGDLKATNPGGAAGEGKKTT